MKLSLKPEPYHDTKNILKLNLKPLNKEDENKKYSKAYSPERSTAVKLLGRISYFDSSSHSPSSLPPNFSAALNGVALWSERNWEHYRISTIMLGTLENVNVS